MSIWFYLQLCQFLEKNLVWRAFPEATLLLHKIREWEQVNRCILNVTIFQQKNYKQFAEPNYFFFRGGDEADFKNGHSG